MPQSGVLLIDPDQTLVAPVRQALEGAPYALRLAGSGAHALEAIGDGEIEAVLVSLALREPSALTLVGDIAQRWPDLPLVVVTAPGGRADGLAARDAGAWDFLEPPGDLGRERLLTVLANALDRRRLRRELHAARAAAPETLNLETRERQAIVAALESTRWNKQAAARLLGLHRPTLYAKMRKHGIPQARPT
ncbi:MAG TPA: helix-turn-helix domain-containing protein [Methylomirabilota bacterium]|jgi:DNA-binding NtrC family response regulator|nr:helix-turn-helix domain-containing protein [Methylomirabilota bacterium]